MKEDSSITKQHHIDCTDMVIVGEFTTIAGYGTQILSHSFSLEKNSQACAPIQIGHHCWVSTRSVVLPGSVLPSQSVLGAGAVLQKKYTESFVLYGGVPAKYIKKMDETLKVSFGPNRVDIVSTKVDDCWESFNATILRISLILRNERLVFNRLALCANVSFSLDPGVGEQAYRILTNNDDHPVEWQIRKVIRTKFNDSILVNNVYTLSRNAVVVNGTDLSDKLILDLDFNTLSGTSVELIEAIQNSYWEATSAMIDDGIKHYISIFENKE